MKEEVSLNNGQAELNIKLKNFLNGSDRIFRLIGPPGTGKSYMTRICLDELLSLDIKNNSKRQNVNVLGVCLAHQAKNVLMESIPNVHTYAKVYGLEEVYDEITGARSFQPKKKNNEALLGECNIPVFVHDEVSQYTREMMDNVLDTTSMYSKIIFIGDKAQLPPIDPTGQMGVDEDSPVFSLELPERCQHELTEIVRQTLHNPILDLSAEIRKEIFGSQNINRILDIIRKPNLNNGVGYSFVNYNDFMEHSKEKDFLKTAVIGFRNKQSIDFFNEKLRNYRLNNPVNRIIKDDIIMMKDSFYIEDAYGIYCVFENSQSFKITDVHTQKTKFRVGGKQYYIDTFVAKTSLNDELFICPTDNGEVDFQEALSELAIIANQRRMSWKEFWDFKKSFCKFSYAYAITAYKAQGSTYETVYVDINDILLTRPLTPKRKLQTIYTAITRAKYDVWFLKGSK
jgi:hypothetical protein